MADPNKATRDAIARALGAVHLLSDSGTQVTGISVRRGAAIITVAQPPPGVEGVTSVVRPVGLLREERRAAPYYNCQLEWIVRTRSRRNVVGLPRREAMP